MPEAAQIGLPEEMRFLLKAQMAEADLIVLNKIDLLSAGDVQRYTDFIAEHYPQARVMAMSALTGEGVDAVVDHLMSSSAPAEHRDIGYGSAEFMAAEKLLSWYNRRVFLEEKDDKAVDFNAVVAEIFENIRSGLRAKGGNVPHLKAFAAGQNGDFVKASLIGVDHETEFAARLNKSYSAISLIINARAAAGSQDMADIVDAAIERAAEKYSLRAKTFFVESFGMMEEGRGNGGRASRYE